MRKVDVVAMTRADRFIVVMIDPGSGEISVYDGKSGAMRKGDGLNEILCLQATEPEKILGRNASSEVPVLVCGPNADLNPGVDPHGVQVLGSRPPVRSFLGIEGFDPIKNDDDEAQTPMPEFLMLTGHIRFTPWHHRTREVGLHIRGHFFISRDRININGLLQSS